MASVTLSSDFPSSFKNHNTERFVKPNRNFVRKYGLEKRTSLCPVITDELCLCPGEREMGYQLPLGSSFPTHGSHFPILSGIHNLSSWTNSLENGNSKTTDLMRCKLKMVAKHWILSSQSFLSVALDLASVYKRDREYFGSPCAKQIPNTDV